MPGLKVGAVARITNINPKTLHHWDRTGFLSPSAKRACGTGKHREYTFSDLIALRVARELRDAGISLHALRKIVRRLQNEGEFEHPLANPYLVTDGQDVYVKNENGLRSILCRPGQGAFFFVVDLNRVVAELRPAFLRWDTAAKRVG
jgi:DNA-binding transcriptional MerR regulator